MNDYLLLVFLMCCFGLGIIAGCAIVALTAALHGLIA